MWPWPGCDRPVHDRGISRHTARPISIVAVLVAVVVTLGVPLTVCPATARAAPAAAPGAFVAIGPCRLADTRSRFGVRRLDASTVRVTVAGACGAPTTITSAAVTLTVTNTVSTGFATVWPAGRPRPWVSNVNWERGQTRANAALVGLSFGSVDVFVSSPADIVLDVSGAFTPSGAATAGRLVVTTPQRLLDTRLAGQPVLAGTALRVALPGDVPADAIALAATVTITDSRNAGYVSVHPAGRQASLTSILNADAPGQTRAATVLVPIAPAGLEVYSSGGGDIVVDVTGYVTGPSAAVSEDGLFVPADPQRMLDTRQAAPVTVGSARTLAIPVDGASAVAVNWTMVDAGNDGWGSIAAAHTPWSGTSSLNVERDGTAANLAINAVSPAGVVARVSVSTDLVADLQGWFTGAATQPAPLPNDGISPYGEVVPGPRDGVQRRILLVGDSLGEQSLPWVVSGLPGWRVDSLVYGGTAACDWVDLAREVTAATAPDLVVFTFVGNALTPCTGFLGGAALLQRYLSDLDRLCAAVSPTPCVAVGQPALAPWVVWTMPAGDEPTTSYRQLAVNGRWGFVDAGREVENLDGTYAAAYRDLDGIHFSEAGSQRYGAAIARYLQALVA